MLLVMVSFVVGHPYFCLSPTPKINQDVEEVGEGSVGGSIEKRGTREGENEEGGKGIETRTSLEEVVPTFLPTPVVVSSPVTSAAIKVEEEQKEIEKHHQAPI